MPDLVVAGNWKMNTSIPEAIALARKVLDGATGVSQWTPLAKLYTGQRTLRLADGPDAVSYTHLTLPTILLV